MTTRLTLPLEISEMAEQKCLSAQSVIDDTSREEGQRQNGCVCVCVHTRIDGKLGDPLQNYWCDWLSKAVISVHRSQTLRCRLRRHTGQPRGDSSSRNISTKLSDLMSFKYLRLIYIEPCWGTWRTRHRPRWTGRTWSQVTLRRIGRGHFSWGSSGIVSSVGQLFKLGVGWIIEGVMINPTCWSITSLKVTLALKEDGCGSLSCGFLRKFCLRLSINLTVRIIVQ